MNKIEETYLKHIAKAEKAQQVSRAMLINFGIHRRTYDGICVSSDSNKPLGLCGCPECREVRAVHLINLARQVDLHRYEGTLIEILKDIKPNDLREYARKELKVIGSPYAN